MRNIMELGKVYHLYDHGADKNNVFEVADNYRYFLKRYSDFILPVADTFAYCLMPNHFHFAVRVKSREKILQTSREILESWRINENTSNHDLQLRVSKQFANLFNSYVQAFNKQQSRRGALFTGRFCRKPVENVAYFRDLVCYIHYNPVHHGFCENFIDWYHSSYTTIVHDDEPTFIRRDLLFKTFEGKEAFIKAHLNWKPKIMEI